MVAPQVVTQRDYVVSIVWRSCVIVPLLWPTQEKRGEEKNLSDPAREKLACSLARKIDQN